MDIKRKNEIVSELLRNSPPNVQSVGFGFKKTNGVSIQDHAIIYTVEKKLPIDQLQTSEIIQTEITIDGETFKTDVVEGKIELLSECSWYNNNKPDGTNGRFTGSYRPLKGGCSCVNITDPSATAGTLGLIAVDKDDDTLVGISNNHVLIQDAFYTSQRNTAAGSVYQNIRNNIGTQPGKTDGGTEEEDRIGLVKKYVPIYPESSEIYNQVDAAAISIDPPSITPDLIDSDSWKQIGWTETPISQSIPDLLKPEIIKPLNEQSYLPFADEDEIDVFLSASSIIPKPDPVPLPPDYDPAASSSFFGQNILFSSGRTTGMKIMDPNNALLRNEYVTAVRPDYDLQGVRTPALFNRCFSYSGFAFQPNGQGYDVFLCPWAGAGGDSGSAILGYINGEYKVIGILFAGNEFGKTIYGLRIDEVANQLNIRAWDGTSTNYAAQNIEKYVVAGGSNSKTVTVNGNKYWQAGLASNTTDPPTTP